MLTIGPLQGLIQAAAADAAGDLNVGRRFLGPQPNADQLMLLVELTATGACQVTLRPVILIRSDNDSVREQWELTEQQVTVAGTDSVKQVIMLDVPSVFEIAVRVVSITGTGALVKVRGCRGASTRI